MECLLESMPVQQASPTSPISKLQQVWLLRMLAPLGGMYRFAHHYGYSNDSIATLLSLPDKGEIRLDERLAAIKAAWLVAERTLQFAEPEPTDLSRNVARLAELLALTHLEAEILNLVLALHCSVILRDAEVYLGELYGNALSRTVAALLGQPDRAVQHCLLADSKLFRSGLLTYLQGHGLGISGRILPMSEYFCMRMDMPAASTVTLMQDHVITVPASRLLRESFRRLESELDILLPHLQRGLLTQKPGLNVLLYGRPGVGKTELARLLPSLVGAEALEVVSTLPGATSQGADLTRLQALTAAQHIFAQSKSVLIFDEAEGIFNGTSKVSEARTGAFNKYWLNKLLENNLTPTIWITNRVAEMDSAFLRRFDMVIEVPPLSRCDRERMLNADSDRGLRPETVRLLASTDELMPAHLERAFNVVSSSPQFQDMDARSAAIETVINGLIQCQRGTRLNTRKLTSSAADYDLTLVNTDIDLEQMLRHLSTQDRPSARLCFYGPPGTGKTAFAKSLAERLGLPLLVKTASDLLAPYLGESEQQISKAFAEATEQGSVLLIDEIDGFLQGRERAVRGWEVTQVNQLLVQLEQFDGIFIGTTNMLESLDLAALRRFDMKVGFDYLKPEQACSLMQRVCRQLNGVAPDEYLLAQLRGVPRLTLGDFEFVLRQARIRGIRDATEVMAVLKAESLMRRGAQPMGFLA